MRITAGMWGFIVVIGIALFKFWEYYEKKGEKEKK